MNKPCTLLGPIQKAKYPAITDAEEKISIPLQALCQALFDATLVHLVNIAAPSKWHEIKMSLSSALVQNKDALTISILETQYADCDVIFLQECAAAMVPALEGSPILNSNYAVFAPNKLDPKRDQNSIILVSCKNFDVSSRRDVTSDVEKVLDANQVGVAAGDLCVFMVQANPTSAKDSIATASASGSWLLASFHGDTDGLQTLPMIKALQEARGSFGANTLLFGMDANAHRVGLEGKKLSAKQLVEGLPGDLGENWGGKTATDPDACCTTFCTRTYLQPQLNKAVPLSDIADSPNTDRNPKDYIIFDKVLKVVGNPMRDNTGTRNSFIGTPFPTLRFPSDHAILLSKFLPIREGDLR